MAADLFTVEKLSLPDLTWQLPQEINLALKPADILLVVGLNANICTSLLRTLAQGSWLEGRVCFVGQEISGLEYKQQIGWVPHGQAFYGDLTCAEFLRVFASAYEVPEHYRPYMISEAYTVTHLEAYLDTVIRTIADIGVLRRLSLARALVHDPRVLLIDDLLSDLEPAVVKDMLSILQDIRSTGKSLIISSPLLHPYSSLASQVLLLLDDSPYVYCNTSHREPLDNIHLMQIQLLDNSSIDLCLAALKNDKISSVLQNAYDLGIVRFIYSGPAEELKQYIQSLQDSGCHIVTCFEINTFLQ